MALTPELITAQEQLKGLTEEQVATLVNLSKNDEDTVIGRRIGEIYGDIDKDIKETFGVDKDSGEKTYNYLKRAGSTVKQTLEDVRKEAARVKSLEREKAELETKMRDGKGTEAIAQKLKDTEDKLADSQKKYQKDIEEWKQKATTNEQALHRARLDFEFDKATTGLQFKPEITDGLKDIMVGSAKAKILNTLTPDWIDDGKGGQRQVFRDKSGTIQNNPDNQLNPYTASELITRELKEALAQTSSGTGTKTPSAGNRQDGVSISGAKTQLEADEIITKSLLAKGMTKGSEKFAAEQTKLRQEHKVEDLPIR